MALRIKHKEIDFGVGDRIKVSQKVKEGEKYRLQVFDGMVIAIKGEGENKSFTVRRIGAQQIGIERIYPLISPSIDKIEVVRTGTEGVKRAKLYYIRHKSKREIEKIYSRSKNQVINKNTKSPKISKKSKINNAQKKK